MRVRPLRRRPSSLAILPFAGAGRDAEIAGFGLAWTLAERLAPARELRVIPAPRSLTFEPDIAPEDAGRRLHVDAVLIGSLAHDGAGIEVEAALIDVLAESELWSERYLAQCDDVAEVRRAIAAAVAGITCPGPSHLRRGRAGTHERWEPFAAYARGRWLELRETPADLLLSADAYAAAAAADAQHAAALAALASTCCAIYLQSTTGSANALLMRAVEAATRALDLDDALAEAHAALGVAATLRDDRQHAARHFQRALRLDPLSPRIRRWHALELQARGRGDDAAREMECADLLEAR